MIQSTPVRCPKCGKTLAEFVGPMAHHYRRGVLCTFAHGWITCDCGEQIEVNRGRVVGNEVSRPVAPLPKISGVETNTKETNSATS